MRIVGHIQNQSRLARHDLKPPRQLHKRQAIAHRLRIHRQPLAQSLDRREHTAGVHQLIRASQRRISQTRIAPAAPGPAPLLLVALVIEILTDSPQISANLPGMVNHRLRRHRIAHNRWPACAQNPRFLAPNALAVWAEVFHVIQINAGDDGAIGIDDVHRIQPPAQPHLQNHHIQLPRLRMATHHQQKGQGGELKVSQADFRLVFSEFLASSPFHICASCYEIGSVCALPTNPAALQEMHQMRAGVHTGLVAGLRVNRLQHRAGRAFAIGARHRDHGAYQIDPATDLDAAPHHPHPLQTHVNVFGMQALNIG